MEINKETADAVKCACGCGKPLDLESEWQRKFKHIPGHQRIGKRHKVAAKLKIQAAWTPAMRKAASERAKSNPVLVQNHQPREQHARWKGGRFKLDEGYIGVNVPSDHPYVSMAWRQGDIYVVREHRLVMAEHLGRPLEPAEVVHHRNLDPTDNSIDNLLLLQNNAEHRRLHKLLKEMSEEEGLKVIREQRTEPEKGFVRVAALVDTMTCDTTPEPRALPLMSSRRNHPHSSSRRLRGSARISSMEAGPTSERKAKTEAAVRQCGVMQAVRHRANKRGSFKDERGCAGIAQTRLLTN